MELQRPANALLTATLLSTATLFAGAAQAMQIVQFDKMSGADQDEYVAELVQGAEPKMFTTNAENGISIGMNDFMMSLALARVTDGGRVRDDPNAVRLEVEHAMLVMLKHEGIVLPKSFMQVMDGFKPRHPAQ